MDAGDRNGRWIAQGNLLRTAAEILGANGLIARRLTSYESRAEQLQMASAVQSAIDDKKHLIVEAGTGVGKSFGYLVPALIAATRSENKKRIIVSTHTIALQEQLIKKDLPFLRAIWPNEFSAVLVKGRSNYISKRRAEVAQSRQRDLFIEPEAERQLETITTWMEESRDGSLADLPFKPLPMIWEAVQSEHGNCLGKKCPKFDSCHYFAARRRMWNADVLVVNHALFFADLALRELDVSMLPEYDVVIFDEAHTLEEVASDHLGLGITSGSIDYTLNKLYNARTQRGLFVTYHLNHLMADLQHARNMASDFFIMLSEAKLSLPKNGRVRKPLGIDGGLGDALRALARKITDEYEHIPEEADRIELAAANARLLEIALSVDAWIRQEQPESIYWIETDTRQRVRLESSPISIATHLKRSLWSEVGTAILTSATLSTAGKGDFSFFTNRLGLDEVRPLTLGSPFDYQQQATLHLLRGVPDPGTEVQQFETVALELTKKFIELTDGHAFVLFTSYRAMQVAGDRLGRWFAERKYRLFSQADGMQRSKMVELFRETPRSVLFGTDSFWQGVDIPGDALQW